MIYVGLAIIHSLKVFNEVLTEDYDHSKAHWNIRKIYLNCHFPKITILIE